MRILVLSFYFQPDLSACSFRTTALVNQLRRDPDCQIDVVTTFPNRYASYAVDAPEYEENANVRVYRIVLPAHKSGMLDQAKAFTRYYRKTLSFTRGQRYDMVFTTSSRLFTAFLGARIATRIKRPLYLDIRDIFVDTIKDVLPSKIAWITKPFFSMVEKYAFGKAGRINLVSKGFAEYFKSRYPRMEFRWFTNGIDDEFLEFVPSAASTPVEGRPLRVLCAGNIGEGQGLHTILPELGEQLHGRADFKVVGDGGRKELLRKTLSDRGVTNVCLCDPINRKQLIKEYQAADVLFLHLNDYPAFKKVLPSKIFEYAALGKPIWAGVAGYAADFLRSEVDNVAVFPPGDAKEAIKQFSSLSMAVKPREAFVKKYARATIMSEMAKDIMNFKLKEEIK